MGFCVWNNPDVLDWRGESCVRGGDRHVLVNAAGPKGSCMREQCLARAFLPLDIVYYDKERENGVQRVASSLGRLEGIKPKVTPRHGLTSRS